MIYSIRDGEAVLIEIVGVKNSSWVICKFPDGKEELVHRKYIIGQKGMAEVEQAMNAVTDGNAS